MHMSMMDTEIDMISNLPDQMLEHILSLLPTKEAVQKCIISKRWTNLWTSFSRLNFDENDFISGNTKERYAKFEIFGDMVLNHRESSYIHTVQMKFHDYSFCDLVRKWINSCKKFNPRVLSIEVPLPFRYFLEFMFTCETVEDMSLKINTCKDWSYVPKTVNMPRIKILYLNKTRLDEKSLTRLFSGCPVLEDVSLDMCHGEFSSIFKQKKLTSLSLINCVHSKQQRGLWELNLLDAVPEIVNLPCIRRLNLNIAYLDKESIHKLLIGCPLLEELFLENCYGEFPTLFKKQLKCLSLKNCLLGKSHDTTSWKIERAMIRTNLSVLIECSFDPSRCIFNSPQCPSIPLYQSSLICNTSKDMAPYFCNTPGLAIFFSGVENLEFCAPANKVDLKKELRKIGTFHNLKNLLLKLADWCMDPNYEFDIVAWFLNKSPNLKKLTLYNPKHQLKLNKRGEYRRVVLRHDEKVYYNLLSVEFSYCKKLEEVEIKFFKNHFSDHHNFKKTLLEDMKGLKNVKVVISEFDE